MCEYCHSSHHLRGCPNEDEARTVTRCAECHVEILEGEDYYEIAGVDLCENCVEECRKTAEIE